MNNNLSPREVEVVKLVNEGNCNKDIAAKMHITPQTVKIHLGNIYRKLDVESKKRGKRLKLILLYRYYVSHSPLP